MFISQTLRRAVQLNPNGVATIYANRKQSWREFEHRVARLAAGVRSLKVADGDRVAILIAIWNISMPSRGPGWRLIPLISGWHLRRLLIR